VGSAVAFGVTIHTTAYNSYSAAQSIVTGSSTSSMTRFTRIDVSTAPQAGQPSITMSTTFATLSSYSIYIVQVGASISTLGTGQYPLRYGYLKDKTFTSYTRDFQMSVDGVQTTDVLEDKIEVDTTIGNRAIIPSMDTARMNALSQVLNNCEQKSWKNLSKDEKEVTSAFMTDPTLRKQLGDYESERLIAGLPINDRRKSVSLADAKDNTTDLYDEDDTEVEMEYVAVEKRRRAKSADVPRTRTVPSVVLAPIAPPQK